MVQHWVLNVTLSDISDISAIKTLTLSLGWLVVSAF